MADKTPRFRRSVFSQRAKTMLNMVGAEKKIICSIPKTSNEKTKKSENSIVEEEINKLYARPYSMTSSVFMKFCETQTTLSSYHFHHLRNHVNKLNEKFPLNNTTCEWTPSQITTPELEVQDLVCYEEMPSVPEKQQHSPTNNKTQNNDNLAESPLPSTQLPWFDFDSDDSVRDKDYIPSSSSDDSDYDLATASSSQKTLVKRHFRAPRLVNPIPLQQPANFNQKVPIKKRRNTVDFHGLRCVELESVRQKRRNTIDAIQESQNKNSDCIPSQKRKLYKTSLAHRIKEKKQLKMLQYAVKPGCYEKCLKKCSMHIDEEQRKKLNQEYWSLTWEQRRLYIRQRIAIAVPKKKCTNEPIRNPRRSFTLKTSDGNVCEVCKVFFLTTLGFKKNNDKILRLDSDVDRRGKHVKTPAYDRQLLTQHVESFHPYEPHYRREHAPLRRYLPSDINIRYMHKDFCKKNPNIVVSYELYRKHLKCMNISFTRLGNEDCEACESYHLHSKQSSHDATAQLEAECTVCVQYARHHEKYTKARQLYTSHKNLPHDENQIFYTTDLEKVIMLPRMETFKSVIFCQRLIAFNQTFAPVGKITNSNKPVTVIWHDGIAGRKQDDIMSAFYAFLMRNRDVGNVNIWLDNCSAQNKNWLLFSLLVHMVNSDLISTNNITLHYFEPGHTFMSSDQVHHQVELAMKKKGKLYDFQDFVDAVSSINNSKVIVQSLTPENFINIPNLISDRRIQKSIPRAYLKNMVQVTFKRNDFDLHYKNDFNDEFIALRFMNDKYLKSPRTLTITFRSSPKGIDSLRKSSIIDKLSAIIPPHKLSFWSNLPISNVGTTNETATNDIRSRKTM